MKASEPGTAPWANVPSLQGDHVSLEPLQKEHAAGLRAALADGRLWELWFASVPEPEAVEEYIDAALSSQASGDAMAFVVRDAAGEVVGTTRYYRIDRQVPRLTIGYTWYATRVQRTGVNTQAKLLLLQYAFETLGCQAVGFETSWFNERSRTAIERLGAKQDGVIRNHMRHRDGSLRDTVVYSIIANEWPAVHRNLQERLRRNG